uniref:Chlororespiratory reduction 3 n=1 Tax=Pelargonium transvaalense TaxID=158603 RepID=A0A0F7GZH3_9ROSI
MSFLSYLGSSTRALVLASLPDNSQPPQTTKTKNNPRPRPRPRPKQQQQQQPQRPRPKPKPKPTLIQMERAIGAGSYRDTDTASSDAEVKKTEYDGLLPITTGQFETPVEESLRRTGEWLVQRTSRGPGKGMLLFVLKWILPIWTLSLLVGTGIIKLPFSTPFLDDLFM